MSKVQIELHWGNRYRFKSLNFTPVDCTLGMPVAWGTTQSWPFGADSGNSYRIEMDEKSFYINFNIPGTAKLSPATIFIEPSVQNPSGEVVGLKWEAKGDNNNAADQYDLVMRARTFNPDGSVLWDSQEIYITTQKHDGLLMLPLNIRAKINLMRKEADELERAA